jgi:hypothetical protein
VRSSYRADQQVRELSKLPFIHRLPVDASAS